MMNCKENGGAGDEDSGGNPSTSIESANPADAGSSPDVNVVPMASRTPFSSLSQVDADLALARALQEQERAFMMLSVNGVDDSDYVSSDGGSYEEEDDQESPELADDDVGSVEGSDYGEDAFDMNGGDIEPSDFNDDEAYARALQDAEQTEVAVRLTALAGLNDCKICVLDAWEEVDPDELSYEELVALGEVVGTESRGLSVDTIASLPSIKFKAQIGEDSSCEQCVICRLDYEDSDVVVILSCKHMYHTECINKWLQINKVCPVCSAEVFPSGPSQSLI
ncbi:hypothetical protein HPP92_022168 [Vanilla planifolia]|uniref:RING-type domain-containing protein n=1 Tax=Vanilla planifolia TaxID=51239 RepID=A0A835UFE1_VANPL|nr:hypothetical protein HPP92_022168 [Vanilla planifolia]